MLHRCMEGTYTSTVVLNYWDGDDDQQNHTRISLVIDLRSATFHVLMITGKVSWP